LEPVTKEDINRLGQVEVQQAESLGLQEFKFSTNDEMMRAIEAKVGR
jgi:hypothetical protein